MSPDVIRVPTRWRGPAESGNGGYACGLVAGTLGTVAAEVTLRSPPPLERDLAVEPGEDGVAIYDGDTLVAEGRPARVEVEIPEVPSHKDGEAASRSGYEEWADGHPFPECAVCGPERAPGDGMRIFPGRIGEGGLFACAWTPDAFVEGESGRVSPECIWAALDCPTSAPARVAPGRPPVVLGRLRASIDAPVRVGDPHVILSWGLGREGRKTTTAGALFDARGSVLGRAQAVWIELKE